MPEKIDILRVQLTPKQKKSLLAIYEDYLYFSRHLENTLKVSTIRTLAQWQTDMLYKDDSEPKFPWKIESLTKDEKEQYQAFIDEKVQENNGVGYISLQYTNPQRNNTQPISYIPENYRIINMDMDLPNAVERYIITYPEDSQIGNTPFLVDGKYKTTYTQKESETVPIKDIFNKPKVQTEFRILFNILNYYENNKDLLLKKHLPGLYEFFAVETLAPIENSILEVLGSFADETQKISRQIYGNNNSLLKAQQDNFIPSAKDFEDYIHIRHLMRHQWDTMDELGTFNSVLAERNKQKRAVYQESYNRVCDKPLKQRISTYITILKQLQSVIKRVYPDILIRDNEESNNKFVERIKAYQREHSQKDITVITNYSFYDERRQNLLNNARKVLKKTGANLIVMDEFRPLPEKFQKIEEDYRYRGWFLNTYNNLECQIMTYCLTRGYNLRSQKAWEYFYKSNLIPKSDVKMWQDYRQLRNELSHSHYNLALREQVRATGDDFVKKVNEIERKINELYPRMRLVDGNVYECFHADGKKVVLNFKTHEIIDEARLKTLSAKKEKTPRSPKRKVEKFENGVEVVLENQQIISVEMPNNVKIDLEKQRIHFAQEIKFYNNAQNFNVFQTENSKVLTDKRFKVTGFVEKGKSQKVKSNDMFVVDYKHRFSTNDIGQLKDFSISTGKQKITVRFRARDNYTEILLPDNVWVRSEKEKMSIIRNGETLSYQNYKEFLSSYQPDSLPKINSKNSSFSR